MASMQYESSYSRPPDPWESETPLGNGVAEDWARVMMDKNHEKHRPGSSMGGAATVQSLEEWGGHSERNSDIGTPTAFQITPTGPISPAATWDPPPPVKPGELFPRGEGEAREDTGARGGGNEMSQFGAAKGEEVGPLGGGLWGRAKASTAVGMQSMEQVDEDERERSYEPTWRGTNGGSTGGAGEGSWEHVRRTQPQMPQQSTANSSWSHHRSPSPGQLDRHGSTGDLSRIPAESLGPSVDANGQKKIINGGTSMKADWADSRQFQYGQSPQTGSTRTRQKKEGLSRGDSGGWSQDQLTLPPSRQVAIKKEWPEPDVRNGERGERGERSSSRGQSRDRSQRTMTPDRYRNLEGGNEGERGYPQAVRSMVRDLTPGRYRVPAGEPGRGDAWQGGRGGGPSEAPRSGARWSGELSGGGGERTGARTREWTQESLQKSRSGRWEDAPRSNGVSPLRKGWEGGREDSGALRLGMTWSGGRPPNGSSSGLHGSSSSSNLLRRESDLPLPLSDDTSEDDVALSNGAKRVLGWPDEKAIEYVEEDSPTDEGPNAARIAQYAREVEEELRRRNAEQEQQAREAQRERRLEMARASQYEERYARSNRGSSQMGPSRARSQSQERSSSTVLERNSSRDRSPATNLHRGSSVGPRSTSRDRDRERDRDRDRNSERDDVERRFADDVAIAKALQEEYGHRGREGEALQAAMQQQMRYDDYARRTSGSRGLSRGNTDSSGYPPRDTAYSGELRRGVTYPLQRQNSGHGYSDGRGPPQGAVGEDSGGSSMGSPQYDTGATAVRSRGLDDMAGPTSVAAKIFGRLASLPHVLRVNSKPPSESAATTDHQRLLERLHLYGVVEKRVKGDGNCQFRAISDQLYGSSDQHQAVRQAVIEQLRSFRDWYMVYVPERYDDYVKKMGRNHEWGDHVTLQAAADKFGIRISLLTSHKENGYIEIFPRTQRSSRILWLSFWSEVHYNSLYVDTEGIPPPEPAPKKKHWLF